MKSNMEPTEDVKKEMTAVANIMFTLKEFGGQNAIEILTGVLCAIISATANAGKETEITDAVIKQLKRNKNEMKNMNPFAVLICPLKKNQPSCPGGDPNLN
jgi:hypothetical protein